VLLGFFEQLSFSTKPDQIGQKEEKITCSDHRLGLASDQIGKKKGVYSDHRLEPCFRSDRKKKEKSICLDHGLGLASNQNNTTYDTVVVACCCGLAKSMDKPPPRSELLA
jgi:hypothetical protein